MDHNVLNPLFSVAEKARPLICFIWSVERWFFFFPPLKLNEWWTFYNHEISHNHPEKKSMVCQHWAHIPGQQQWLELGGHGSLFTQSPSLPVVTLSWVPASPSRGIWEHSPWPGWYLSHPLLLYEAAEKWSFICCSNLVLSQHTHQPSQTPREHKPSLL